LGKSIPEFAEMVKESPGLILNFLGTNQKSWAKIVTEAANRIETANRTK
jgi:hypothetical protein